MTPPKASTAGKRAPRKSKAPGDVKVAPAVRAELAAIAKRKPELATGAHAAAALALARRMDSTKTSTPALSMCADRLTSIMDRLYELAPPEHERDAVDEVAAARAKRRAGVSAAADPAGS